MEKNGARTAVFALILSLIGIAATYAYQCLICILDAGGVKAQSILIMLVLSGLPMVIIQLVFVWLAIKRFDWELKYLCLTQIITSILFIGMLLTLFPHIPIPYILIPAREMAGDFLQLLMELFAGGTAGICLLAGLIVFTIKCRKIR